MRKMTNRTASINRCNIWKGEREKNERTDERTEQANTICVQSLKWRYPSFRPFVHPFWTVHPRLSRVSMSIRLSPFISTSWPEGLKINVCSSCFFLQCNFFSSLNLLSSNLCVSVYVWSFANMWRCIKSAIKKSLTISAFVVASVVTVGSQNITRVSVCVWTNHHYMLRDGNLAIVVGFGGRVVCQFQAGFSFNLVAEAG